MTGTANLTRPRITVRLDPAVRDRILHIAAHEHRSVAGYIQMLIERDLRARDEAERVIYVFTVPELEGVSVGPVQREDGETDARYAERAEALRNLLGEY